jgi:hypothetical protein
MNFEAFLVEPQEVKTQGLAAFYSMPFGATMANTGDRLSAAANKAGIPILAADMFAQRLKKIDGLESRIANDPEEHVVLDEINCERLLSYRAWRAKHDLVNHSVIGIGDSLGASAIQGMALKSIEYHGKDFDALLLRDDWNLNPSGVLSGMLRYFTYT